MRLVINFHLSKFGLISRKKFFYQLKLVRRLPSPPELDFDLPASILGDFS